MGRLSLGIACCFAVLALGTAPAAPAAQRFAAPVGGGEECTQAEPCSLNVAVEKAKANDEVILAAGHYVLSGYLQTQTEGLSIHGDLSAPMPTISATLRFQAFQVEGAGSVVSHLEVIDKAEEGEALFCVGAVRVERVRLAAIGEKAIGLWQSEGCEVRDSLVLASGEDATAIRSVGSSEVTNVTRNVTAIAGGSGSIGVSAYNEDMHASGTYVLDLKNSIAQGGKTDLLSLGGFEGPSEIVVAHSNFDVRANEENGKVTDGGSNQSAPALFVDAANGDYHEAPGSPTIDAGIADRLGPTDLDGNPRVLGPAVDIGAYEAQALPAPAIAPAEGQLESLVIRPRKFRGNAAGALTSKKRPPRSATVTYSLSAPARVEFHVERAGTGRRVGGKCVKRTRANRNYKKCVLYKPLKGRFSIQAPSRAGSFRFSGKVGGRLLKPGPYRLVGHAGSSIRRAPFTIVR